MNEAKPSKQQAISEVIRARLKANKVRFHANDNIAAHIQPGELDSLVDEVSEKVQALLESLVIDTENNSKSKGGIHAQ